MPISPFVVPQTSLRSSTKSLFDLVNSHGTVFIDRSGRTICRAIRPADYQGDLRDIPVIDSDAFRHNLTVTLSAALIGLHTVIDRRGSRIVLVEPIEYVNPEIAPALDHWRARVAHPTMPDSSNALLARIDRGVAEIAGRLQTELEVARRHSAELEARLAEAQRALGRAEERARPKRKE